MESKRERRPIDTSGSMGLVSSESSPKRFSSSSIRWSILWRIAESSSLVMVLIKNNVPESGYVVWVYKNGLPLFAHAEGVEHAFALGGINGFEDLDVAYFDFGDNGVEVGIVFAQVFHLGPEIGGSCFAEGSVCLSEISSWGANIVTGGPEAFPFFVFQQFLEIECGYDDKVAFGLKSGSQFVFILSCDAGEVFPAKVGIKSEEL